MSPTKTPGTTGAALERLQELHRSRGTMALLSRHEQAEIRQALRRLSEAHAVSLHEAVKVPYALARVTDAVTADALQLLRPTDLRTLSDFAATLPQGKP